MSEETVAAMVARLLKEHGVDPADPKYDTPENRFADAINRQEGVVLDETDSALVLLAQIGIISSRECIRLGHMHTREIRSERVSVMNIPDYTGPRVDIVLKSLEDEVLECVFSVIANIKAGNPAHDWTPDELYHAFDKRISLPLTVRIAGLAFLMAAYLDEAEKQGIQQPTTTTRVSLVTSAVGGGGWTGL